MKDTADRGCIGHRPRCRVNVDGNGDGAVNFADIDAYNRLLVSGNRALAFTLTWDGENRLAAWRPTFPADAPGAQKVTLRCDYQGRRVEKKVYNWTGGWWQTTASLHGKFVWDGAAVDTPAVAKRQGRQALAESGSSGRVKVRSCGWNWTA